MIHDHVSQVLLERHDRHARHLARAQARDVAGDRHVERAARRDERLGRADAAEDGHLRGRHAWYLSAAKRSDDRGLVLQSVERDAVCNAADGALQWRCGGEPERERVGQLPLEGGACDRARNDFFGQLPGHPNLRGITRLSQAGAWARAMDQTSTKAARALPTRGHVAFACTRTVAPPALP